MEIILIISMYKHHLIYPPKRGRWGNRDRKNANEKEEEINNTHKQKQISETKILISFADW